jgi:glycosyltransferase involved in cell wall biosynthesis
MRSHCSISVLINNYNYARYVVDAVQSALDQTCPPQEVIVVDDGSTDNSLFVLNSAFAGQAKVKIVSQSNAGQLAAIRRGVQVATGDWCFFLDADDTYLPNHLEEATRVLQANPQVACYYCDHQESDGPPRFHSKWPAGLVGPIGGLVFVTGKRFGTITSALGLKREIALQALDLDPSFDCEWRIQADDCLIYGASLAGALIYYNPCRSITYRIHGENSYAGKKRTEDAKHCHSLRMHRFLNARAACHRLEEEGLLELLWRELQCKSNRQHWEIKCLYLKAFVRVAKPVYMRFHYFVRALLLISWLEME